MRVCSSLQAENVRHARKNHEKTETGANYIPRNCNFFLPFQRISFKGQNQKHDNHGLWSQERRSPDTVGGSGAWLQKCSLDIAPCVLDNHVCMINGSSSFNFSHSRILMDLVLNQRSQNQGTWKNKKTEKLVVTGISFTQGGFISSTFFKK